ncbi:MAG: DUF87 domain-containing protein [Anaerolineaceae bacterium]
MDTMTGSQAHAIGYVVGGGLEANLQVRLTVPPQEVQEGSFVVIDSGGWRFYGLVTDLQLGSTNPRFADEQSEERLPRQMAELLHGQTLFTNLAVMPVLMMERGPEPGTEEYRLWKDQHPEESKPIPVKTVPSHHSPVMLADAADIAQIFGEENNQEMFCIGYTREQGHPVCLNLDKFVKRSSGIFGTTGSGKSFLARMILAGLIHADRASALIFDMHNEYGPDSSSSDTGQAVPGLKGKFGAKIRLAGLGARTSFGKLNADLSLEIAQSDITSEDVLLLSQALNLNETAATVLAALEREFGKEWFREFLSMETGTTEQDETGKSMPAPNSVEAWAAGSNVHPKSALALHQKLGRLRGRPYLIADPATKGLDDIIENLENGRHVILSFGKYNTELDYLLVTNLITRKIRDHWEEKTEKFHSENSVEPRPLVVVVEEAHKLLNREMASQTIFSTIAREMRKYYVTLLIIDQRPSQIYDEVMSQLGTRISGSLGDEDDINAVLSGLPGRGALRGMLSKLQAKEEALLLGWGVPMPIPIRSRRYDNAFWQELFHEERSPETFAGAYNALGFGGDDPD